MTKKPIVIGIAGGTGSGKTTLADRIVNYFNGKIAVVHHDNYYKAHYDMSFEERSKLNYDHPDSFDTDLMIKDLHKLRSGKSIQCPVYDYTIHNRSKESITIEPQPIILIEGILIFSDPELCKTMDVKVFVDTDADVRLARRITRDMKERGRTPENIIEQYVTTVKPMHDAFVEPSKRQADILVPEGGLNDVAFDMIINLLESKLK